MRKLLGSVAVVALLAGCGGDLLGESCTSGGPAKAQVSSNPTCALSPGSANIYVTLCADCLATSASCIPEFRSDGSLELAPNYCVNTSSSSTTCPMDGQGCNIGVHQAVCNVNIPSDGPSTRTMTIIGADFQTITGTLNISSSSGNNTCTL